MLVEVRNLVKRYKDVLAVDNVSLAIEEGEILGLLGPNGAGKTTTINAMIGLTRADSVKSKFSVRISRITSWRSRGIWVLYLRILRSLKISLLMKT